MIQVQLKIRPTKAQERTFERWLWHLTGVWNWTLGQIKSNPKLSSYDLRTALVGHAKKIGLPAVAIGGTVLTAHESSRRYLRGISGQPKRKGARRKLSSIAFDHWDGRAPRVRNGRASIPGIGLVRFHRQDIPEGRVGCARLVKRASGWYLCLFVQTDRPTIAPVGTADVGIDPGFSSLLTLSSGEKVEHPHEWRRHEARVGQAQRGARKRLTARLQERVANRRKDRNHKLSLRLVREHALIAFSADRHANIARLFGKSVASAGHYQLRQMLAYKSLAGGRQYVEVASRNSTRACSACAALTGPTGWRGLKVREWGCSACGAHHDRDVNAAVNTLISGRGTRHKSRCEAASGTALIKQFSGVQDV